MSKINNDLKRTGYSIVENALTPEEVTIANILLWDHLETLYPQANRNDPSSWNHLNIDDRGFVEHSHQSQGAWFVRSAPGIKKAFESIWDTDDMITSMDTAIAWKPWKENIPSPGTEGLHIDQTHPNFECVQGMIVLEDVNDASGGLEVIPCSHTNWNDIVNICGDAWIANNWNQNWGPIPPTKYPQGSGKLLHAKKGSLILWDSRLIHGGRKGIGGTDPTKLARAAYTVCMLPRGRCTSEIQDLRKAGFQNGWEFNHDPVNPHIVENSPPNYIPIQLTPEQQAIL